MHAQPIPQRGRSLAARWTMALLCAVALGWSAAADAAAPRQVTVTGDNDFMAGHDHHYTNGLQLAVSADALQLPRLVQGLPMLQGATERRVTLSLGQRIYTPTDKARADPDPADRPYAGWLYAMAEISARHGDAVDTVQLSAGVIGPAALARQTQNAYHALIATNRAQGWGAQLDNEPALMAAVQRSWPARLKVGLGALSADLSPKVGLTVGTVYTYANAGAVLRVGHNMPDDFAATDISLGPPRDGYRPQGEGLGWYAWIGTDARAVAWNTFLDGNLSGSGPEVDRKRFGHDLQWGLAITWNRSRLGFSMVRRSKEFATQPAADEFGQITYSFAL